MKCMWKSNTCTEFTSCNQIKGAGYCQTRMCADYVSKSSCTYVLSLSNP